MVHSPEVSDVTKVMICQDKCCKVIKAIRWPPGVLREDRNRKPRLGLVFRMCDFAQWWARMNGSTNHTVFCRLFEPQPYPHPHPHATSTLILLWTFCPLVITVSVFYSQLWVGYQTDIQPSESWKWTTACCIEILHSDERHPKSVRGINLSFTFYIKLNRRTVFRPCTLPVPSVDQRE